MEYNSIKIIKFMIWKFSFGIY